MKSAMPKVLHELAGRPMLAYVLEACRRAGCIDRMVVVVGFQKEKVQTVFRDQSDLEWAVQEQQKGTGHALMCARQVLGDFRGSLLVLNGDFPFLRVQTVVRLISRHQDSGDEASTVVATPRDPAGYGRIIQEHGRFVDVIEEADLNEAQRAIPEVFAGISCFESPSIFQHLTKLNNHNNQSEYYLPEVLRVIAQAGGRVGLIQDEHVVDLLGVNSMEELEKGRQYLGDEHVQV